MEELRNSRPRASGKTSWMKGMGRVLISGQREAVDRREGQLRVE